MLKRRRLKQIAPFQQRLTEWSQSIRDQAASLPAGIERENLLKKARQADTASHIDDWVNSPGLQPPR
jgi:hypothetical protein